VIGFFSRQRYWGEPFPIVLDEQNNPYAVSEDELPVQLPVMEDFKPTGTPEPPLSKAKDWLRIESDNQIFYRETNTMPQWAGSCWYYLRYIDPKNPKQFVDPEKERYWMPVDLYVGGTEHAVLHLLYARFWHKVLFDLGHVSTAEPFARLVNQGIILGEMEFHVFQTASQNRVSTTDVRDMRDEVIDQQTRVVANHRVTRELLIGERITEDEVERRGDGFTLRSNPAIRVDARSFKMSKSRGNVVNPDEIVRDYGADCFRLYEMYMGPLEAPKPWNTRDIVGMSRFLNAVWRNLVGDEEANIKSRISDTQIPEAIDRQLHRTIKKVGEDFEGLRFNTAIAELIKLNNEMGHLDAIPRSLAEKFVLMLAPLAPHISEELWQRLGNTSSLVRAPWPSYDPDKLVEAMIEVPVQVNGKVRDRVVVEAEADEQTVLQAAEAAEKVRPWVDGKIIVKRVYVPKKLVSLVVK
jgi:leucyl-tRNA synthetase